MSRSKRDSKGKVLNEDVLVEVKPLEPWPDPPPKKERAPQADQKPKGKVLNDDFIVKVKPLEPWPDPPIKKLPSQQPDSNLPRILHPPGRVLKPLQRRIEGDSFTKC